MTREDPGHWLREFRDRADKYEDAETPQERETQMEQALGAAIRLDRLLSDGKPIPLAYRGPREAAEEFGITALPALMSEEDAESLVRVKERLVEAFKSGPGPSYVLTDQGPSFNDGRNEVLGHVAAWMVAAGCSCSDGDPVQPGDHDVTCAGGLEDRLSALYSPNPAAVPFWNDWLGGRRVEEVPDPAGHLNEPDAEPEPSPPFRYESTGLAVEHVGPDGPMIFSGGPDLAVHRPTVHNHGIFAHHDMPCAVCATRHAILDLSRGVYGPCGQCQGEGWTAPVKRSKHWWRRA